MKTGFETSLLALDGPPNPVKDDTGALPNRGGGLLDSTGAGAGVGAKSFGGSGVADGCETGSTGLGAPNENGVATGSAGLDDGIPPNKEGTGAVSGFGDVLTALSPDSELLIVELKKVGVEVEFDKPPNKDGLFSSAGF